MLSIPYGLLLKGVIFSFHHVGSEKLDGYSILFQ